MFRLKITVMGIFTEIYSFRVNVVRDTNVVQDNLSSNFYGKQTEFITKICVCYIGHVENTNCLLVSKLLHLAAKINASKNVVWDISKTTTPSFEISRVGNLVMVK